MITLTSSAETLAVGDHVFHTFPSPEAQVAALVAEVRGHRVIARFAVLHPQTAYGENAARVFSQLVGEAGGAVVRTSSYPADTSDFRKVVGAVAKPPGATMVDYDALFVPDAYQRVVLLASALAYAEIPVGRFRPRSEDVPITLLGLAAWDNDELARRGGQYVEGCIFVDAFDPRAVEPLVQRFVAAWSEHGQGPPSVVEAVGYDTMLLAAVALSHPQGAAQGLREASLVESLTGISRFDEGREAERTWRLLTVARGGVAPLDGAPPPP
jgi:ABC-type branched-subunit amino acid transport system substrate-binding protein